MKYEIANWLTPGLTPTRLVFTTFGGSAHGRLSIEAQDVETGTWSNVAHVDRANGIPSSTGEEIGSEHVNQFTGKEVV